MNYGKTWKIEWCVGSSIQIVMDVHTHFIIITKRFYLHVKPQKLDNSVSGRDRKKWEHSFYFSPSPFFLESHFHKASLSLHIYVYTVITCFFVQFSQRYRHMQSA